MSDSPPPWLSLSLQDVQLLALLLEEGSVTRAAERSGQTQPAVSRKLQRLRESLGDPLLVRSGPKLAPTERAPPCASRCARSRRRSRGCRREPDSMLPPRPAAS